MKSYTQKSEKVVLDIGLKDEYGIIAKWNDYCNDTPRYYENIKADKWHHSGIYISKEYWEEVSWNRGTDKICHLLGIPYSVEKKEKKNYMKEVLNVYRRLRGKDE